MSYFEDEFGGYVGREESEPPNEPTFRQVETLRKLATRRKLTAEQGAALEAMLEYWDGRP